MSAGPTITAMTKARLLWMRTKARKKELLIAITSADWMLSSASALELWWR